MRYIILLLAFGLVSQPGFAQPDWVVKTRPTSSLLDSYLTIGAEKKLGSGLTGELNIKWKRSEFMASQSDVETDIFKFRKGQGFQIDLLGKWYPGKRAPEGFYLAVLQRYRHFSAEPFTYFEMTPPDPDDMAYDIVHKRNQISTMIAGGYQFVFRSSLTLEFICGIGHTRRWVKESLVDEDITAPQVENRDWKYTEKLPAFYLGWTMGYAF